MDIFEYDTIRLGNLIELCIKITCRYQSTHKTPNWSHWGRISHIFHYQVFCPENRPYFPIATGNVGLTACITLRRGGEKAAVEKGKRGHFVPHRRVTPSLSVSINIQHCSRFVRKYERRLTTCGKHRDPPISIDRHLRLLAPSSLGI